MILTTGAIEMLTTIQFLDLCAERTGSDYKSSLRLGKDPSYVSHIRSRGGIFSDEMGLQVAEILDFPDDWMILCLVSERSSKKGTPEHRARLERAAARHAPSQFSDQNDLTPKTGTDHA